MNFTYFKKCLLVIAILSFTILNAQIIDKIVSITNPELHFNYDRYSGNVLNYEDRLIVANLSKIEEFRILPNGDLERIGFFDVNYGFTKNLTIDEDRFYFLVDGRRNDGSSFTAGINIYDLSQSPMQFVTFVELDLINSTSCLFFSDEHILVSDFANQRTVKINKETYQIDGYIEDLYGEMIYRQDNIIIRPSYNQTGGIRMTTYEIDEHDVLTEISSIDIDGFGSALQNIIIENSKAILMLSGFEGGVVIIDYVDVHNPFIFGNVKNEFGFTATLLVDNILYAGTTSNLRVYDNEFGFFREIFRVDRSVAGQRSICLVDSYLYVNAEINLIVMDVSDNYNLVNTYGIRVATLPSISISENEIYYMEIDHHNGIQKIYSVLENEYICSLNLQNISLNFPENFYIKGDRLYLARSIGESRRFYIYQIENQQAILLKSINLGSQTGWMNIAGDMMFFLTTSGISFYDFLDDDLIYRGSFGGDMQLYLSSTPQNYVLNIDDDSVFFRDINEPLNTLYKSALAVSTGTRPAITHLDDGFFAISSVHTNRTQVYSFNFNDESISLISEFNSNLLTSLNEIFTVTGDFPTQFVGSSTFGMDSKFYNIVDGQLVQIGEQKFDRDVRYTYFFPERNKMVQIAMSGIWVHDFEYTTVSDADILISRPQTELLGNIPNPFNPETTIRFNIAVESMVSIDIYNIRGQRVKRLLDGFYDRGSHTVVWDGRDDSGRELGSGLYLYRMVAGDIVETRRMVLLK